MALLCALHATAFCFVALCVKPRARGSSHTVFIVDTEDTPHICLTISSSVRNARLVVAAGVFSLTKQQGQLESARRLGSLDLEPTGGKHRGIQYHCSSRTLKAI
mmetsp:Transcript_21105/g.49801  ORF Transcript_21105/g.49801 Transcript_21105/m.49801 type:complete len:104 (+) Transcript_21105:2485-2796(+)